MIKKIVVLTLILVSSHCYAQENLKDYYYPLGTEKNIKVYKYVEKSNPEIIVYKKLTINPKEKILLTESYSSDFWCYNSIEEKLSENGSEIVNYINYFENAKGDTLQFNGTVIEKDVYKWNGDSKYKYSVEYINPNKGKEILTIGRIKISLDKINIDGTEYETVKYRDQYQIKSLDYSNTLAFYIDSYFAKGIGLVKFKENFFDFSNLFELDEIMSEEQFNELLENLGRENNK